MSTDRFYCLQLSPRCLTLGKSDAETGHDQQGEECVEVHGDGSGGSSGGKTLMMNGKENCIITYDQSTLR